MRCNINCGTCFGPTDRNCDGCPIGLLLANNYCDVVCPFGFYPIFERARCEKCHEGKLLKIIF